MFGQQPVERPAIDAALLGRPGQGSKQGEQLQAVLGPGVVLERTSQRQVLGLGQLGDLVNVGGDEGKRKLGIALVLGQVEAHAAHHVPDRAVLFQVALDTVWVPLGFRRQCRAYIGPDVTQQRSREDFGALHGRHGLDQGRDLVRTGG